MHLRRALSREPLCQGGQSCSGPHEQMCDSLLDHLAPSPRSPVKPETAATRKVSAGQGGACRALRPPLQLAPLAWASPRPPIRPVLSPLGPPEIYLEPQLPWFLPYPAPSPPLQREETGPKLPRAEMAERTRFQKWSRRRPPTSRRWSLEPPMQLCDLGQNPSASLSSMPHLGRLQSLQRTL